MEFVIPCFKSFDYLTEIQTQLTAHDTPPSTLNDLNDLNDTTNTLKEERKKQEDLCCVCYVPFERPSSASLYRYEFGSLSPCKHEIHGQCVLTWIEQQLRISKLPTCPLCRTPIHEYECSMHMDMEAEQQRQPLNMSWRRLGIGVHALIASLTDDGSRFVYGIRIHKDPTSLFLNALAHAEMSRQCAPITHSNHTNNMGHAFHTAIRMYVRQTEQSLQMEGNQHEDTTLRSYDALWNDIMLYMDREEQRQRTTRPHSAYLAFRLRRSRLVSFNDQTTTDDATRPTTFGSGCILS